MKFLVLAAIVGVVAAQSQYNLRGQPRDQRQSQSQYQQREQNPQQYQEEPQQQQQQRSQPLTSDRQPSTTTYIPILQWNKEQEHDGTYRTSYETGNNIIAEESGYLKETGEGENKVQSLVQTGSYSYTSPEGQLIQVNYVADETGFHPISDSIPTSAPVSAEIQKSLDLIYAGIREQEEAAAREAKNPQPISQQIERREDNKNYRF